MDQTRPEIQVKWALHDGWNFTDNCLYFTAVKCKQWEGPLFIYTHQVAGWLCDADFEGIHDGSALQHH